MLDLNSVYDEQVAPLMSQIISICQEHGLPFFASFQIDEGDENEGIGPLMSTTTYTPDGCEEWLATAMKEITEGWIAQPPDGAQP